MPRGLGARAPVCTSSSPADPVVAWTGDYDTDAGHYTIDGSHRVTQWTDQSGNARHFAPDVAADGPLDNVTTTPNGTAALDFNGTSAFLDGPALSAFLANNAFTIFLVGRVDTAPDNSANSWMNDILFGDCVGGSGGNFEVAAKASTSLYAAHWDGNDDATPTQTIVNGSWYVIEARHESGTLYQRLNGGAEVSVASGNTVSLAIAARLMHSTTGVNTYTDGALARLRITNTALSLSTRDAVVAFLRAKYGI